MRNKFAKFAALAVCAGFASCSEYDAGIDPENPYELAYEAAFIKTFGQPAADQDWGFGSGLETRVTVPVPEGNEHHNQNANEWADPDKQFGGWIVPDPLTEGQKERVRLYFQANPNLTYEDPHWEHFFVQQVYTGGTNPGPNSTEVVTAADGTTEYTGAKMDKATVSQSNIYMNRFNNGTYKGGESVEVLDNGQHVGGTSHMDQIMLMVNIDDTSCFGYDMDACEVHHNDRAALVSAAVIDAWAAQNGNPGEPVVDKWNRSFLGYDLALNTEPRLPIYDWSTYPATIKGYESFELDGETYYYLTTNTNMYYADAEEELYENMPQLLNDYLYSLGNFSQEQQTAIKNSVARMKELLAEGWLPVMNSNKIVKTTTGGADGYYSDWIITLCEAKRIADDGEESGGGTEESDGVTYRIIAEDLTAENSSDFDFNDVVFDVTYENGDTKITILAAGGTLPLYVGEKTGNETTDIRNAQEVHEGFGVSTSEMVNTYANRHADKSPYTITISGKELHPRDGIGIWVQKENGGYYELLAKIGEPACKICVNKNFEWCDERQPMEKAYPGFKAWVQDTQQTNWEYNKAE